MHWTTDVLPLGTEVAPGAQYGGQSRAWCKARAPFADRWACGWRRFLTFTIAEATIGDQADGPDDAFEVALLDANSGRSLLGGNGLTHSDAIINRQANGVEHLAPGVTVDQNADGSRTYRIDLRVIAAEFPSGTVVNLAFDLIGFGTDTGNREDSEASHSRLTIRDLRLGAALEAHDDQGSTPEDTVLDIDVRGNDLGAEQSGVSAHLIDRPAHGEVSVNADGSFRYAPQADWHGEDRFTYVLRDGLADSAPATVRLTVSPLADAPTLILTDRAGASREVFRTGWESVDHAGRLPTVVKQGSLEGWQLVSQAVGAAGDRGFTLWSAGDFMLDTQKPGISSVPVTLNAAADNGRNWLELRPPAGGPPQSVAIERSIETVAGARYVLSLDLAGYPGYSAAYNRISISVDGRSLGTDASTSPSGTLAWQTRTFAFVGTGGRQTIRIASATTLLSAVGHGMMIDDITLNEALPAHTGLEDSAIRLPAISAALKDGEGSEALAIAIEGLPVGATLSDGTYRFTATGNEQTAMISDWDVGQLFVTPPPNYHGHFSLTVIATATEQANQSQASSTARVEVTVVPVNDVPLARNASFTLREDSSVGIDFAALISDVDGDPLSVTPATPEHGTLLRKTDGTWTYRPQAHYSGSDHFAYSVTDGRLTATATIEITVVPANHAPQGASTPPATFEPAPGAATALFQVTGTPGAATPVSADWKVRAAALNGEPVIDVRGLSTASLPMIDWSGAQPACFTGTPIEHKDWLADFLGVMPTEKRLADLPTLQISIQR